MVLGLSSARGSIFNQSERTGGSSADQSEPFSRHTEFQPIRAKVARVLTNQTRSPGIQRAVPLMVADSAHSIDVSQRADSAHAIRLFANDVIMIGSVRADWPAPFSVTIGNPRADKLGRNGFECIGRRCLVDRERCVRATFMHSAIENYSMLHLQRWLECRGIKRFGTKSLFMIISHNCQSCMCR